ncbi:hypothetical protein [Moheibacter sediminis]|uniref:hypothetical protein n=1 Tax=Moheibacter sediminis TaxID=1434700 RepID=UPI0013563941|nr:hypothetical protein [Moheibacter sediminis]
MSGKILEKEEKEYPFSIPREEGTKFRNQKMNLGAMFSVLASQNPYITALQTAGELQRI